MSIIKKLLIKKLTFKEKTEIAVALYSRIDTMMETIAALKKIGVDASSFEQSLSVCETLIKENKIWRLI